MKLPTLRQVGGFVMIVNTFLPVIVVVTLGLMSWSTANAIKRNACATVRNVAQAMNDDREIKLFLAAHGDESGRTRTLQALARRLHEQPLPGAGACAQWEDLRASIQGIFANELYGKTVKSIETEIRVVDAKLDSARKAAAQVVPRIHPIKPPDIPGIKEAIVAVNQLFRIVHDALAGLGKAVARLGQGITEPFETAGENMKKEFQKVDYKRAVAGELLDRFWSDTTELFNKFWWFLVGLVLWLTASYALWVQRRFAVGWALLRNRETVQ